MYFRPYHIDNTNQTFSQFVTTSTKNNDPRKDHDTNVCKHEQNKTLFQLRYNKYKKYKELARNFNVILVNLQYIQTYPKKFLSKLSKRFSLEKNKEYIPILYHTKT